LFTQVGDSVNVGRLEADRKRILNLGLFNRVEVRPLNLEKGVVLLITVDERWYFFPFPIFYYNDNDVKKLSYGLGVVHSNVGGRARQLLFSGWLGYNPGVQVSYHDPWVFDEARMFATTRFYLIRQRSKSLELLGREIDELQLGGSWTIGKRYGLQTYVSSTLGFRQVKLDPSVPGKTLNPSGLDRLPELGLAFLYDNRDLYEYPRRGQLVQLFVRRVGFGAPYIHYWRYGTDLRFYQPVIGGLSLCTRAFADLAAGRLPIYDRVYFGYFYRLRGYFNRAFQGENMFLGSGELRLPLLKPRYVSLNLGALRQYTQNLKFGISVALFADTGTLWFDDQAPSFQTLISGYGASLDVHLPYVELVRFAYAINDHGQREGIVILGLPF